VINIRAQAISDVQVKVHGNVSVEIRTLVRQGDEGRKGTAAGRSGSRVCEYIAPAIHARV
jgi:hypothetical protein